MADLGNAAWSETDASNNSATPDGWPEGQAPSTVNNCARAMMGGLKRDWDQRGPTKTSGGSANVQTLTYSVAPAAYVQGMVFSFLAGFTNTGAVTLNVNALGAKAITKNGTVALTGGEILAGALYTCAYDGTRFQLMGGIGVLTVKQQSFTANGTYTPSAGMIYCQVICIGGGGGGGGTAVGGANTTQAAGGGGGGGLAIALLTAAQIGASKAVTVGGGANGGAAGNNNGTAGNDTSVGTLCVGKGGGAGGGAASGGEGTGGAGGVSGTSDIPFVGNRGSSGAGGQGASATVLTLGGAGGPGPWGGGAGQSHTIGVGTSNGGTGGNYGAGGGGGASAGANSSSGGAGIGGVVYITEYCAQ